MTEGMELRVLGDIVKGTSSGSGFTGYGCSISAWPHTSLTLANNLEREQASFVFSGRESSQPYGSGW